MKPFLITFVAVVVAIALTNARVDVAGLSERDRVADLARVQRADEAIVSETEIDQRAWMRACIERDDPVDVLVVGSSTAGVLAQGMFGDARVLNAWGGGASIEDLEAFAQLLRERRARGATVPRVVVIGVDPWLMNGALKDARWLTLADEQRVFVGGTRGVIVARSAWARLSELVNWSTTSATFTKLVASDGSTPAPPRLVRDVDVDAACTAAKSTLTVRHGDGHFSLCPASIGDARSVDEKARRYLADNAHGMAAWQSVDADRLARLERVVVAVRAIGSDVRLVAMPYHPITYASLHADRRVHDLLDELDRDLGDVATRTGAMFVNLRDPGVAGCSAAEFTDSHHHTTSCAQKIAAIVSR